MSEIEVSQADLLREWIEKRIDEDYDYSKPSFKKNDIKEFVNAYPQLNTNQNKVSKHFSEILKQIAEQKGKTPEEMGLKKLKINQSRINQNSDMNVTIEAKPQSPVLIGAPEQRQIIPGQQPQILVGSEGGLQSQINTLSPVNRGNHSHEFVSASIDALRMGIASVVAPLAPNLTDAQLKVLGEQGKPIFDRYFSENEDMLFGLLGIGAILIPNLREGRRLKKEQVDKKKLELEEK